MATDMGKHTGTLIKTCYTLMHVDRVSGIFCIITLQNASLRYGCTHCLKYTLDWKTWRTSVKWAG